RARAPDSPAFVSVGIAVLECSDEYTDYTPVGSSAVSNLRRVCAMRGRPLTWICVIRTISGTRPKIAVPKNSEHWGAVGCTSTRTRHLKREAPVTRCRRARLL